MVDGTVGDDPYLLGHLEVSVLVQPWRASDDLYRGAIVGGRFGGWSGDFTTFHRYGFELGYLYKTRTPLRFLQLGASISGTFDRWDVWLESPEPGDFDGMGNALGVSVRPFVRFSWLELSVPLELGYGFGPGQSYRTHGFQVGLVLF